VDNKGSESRVHEVVGLIGSVPPLFPLLFKQHR